MQVAALRSLALICADAFAAVGQPLDRFLNSSDEHVRAAACRVAALLPSEDWIHSTLVERLLDSVLAVRGEAAIALGSGHLRGGSSGDDGVEVAQASSKARKHPVFPTA